MAPRSPSRGRQASRGRRSPGRRSSQGRRHKNIEEQINEAVKKLLKEKAFLDTSIANRAGAKWPCPCGFKTNFSVRTTCYRCLAPKPSPAQPGSSQPSQRTPAATAARAAARNAASLAAPPPVVVPTVEEELTQARSRFDWAKTYVANSPSDAMACTFLVNCEADLKKAKQAVEASRSHPQRLTACLSRQANLLKQSEAQKAEQDRLALLLTDASSKLLATQASLSEVEQELQMLQAASVGAASAPLGPSPKVNLSALTILVQQCFVAAGVPVPNVDAAILHGMAMGLGISTLGPEDTEMEEDEHLSARSQSPAPGSWGPAGRRTSGGRSSPFPTGLLPDLAKAALAATFISPGPVGTQPGVQPTQVDPPSQDGGTASGSTPSK